MPRDSNTPGPLATADWDRLEPIIRRFESAWQAGARPTIEEYLPAAQAERQAVLVELAHADLEGRLKRGEAACAADYLQRFPELAVNPDAALALIVTEYELRQRQEPALPLAD